MSDSACVTQTCTTTLSGIVQLEAPPVGSFCVTEPPNVMSVTHLDQRKDLLWLQHVCACPSIHQFAVRIMAVRHISNICHFCSDWVTSVAEVEVQMLYHFLFFCLCTKGWQKKIFHFIFHIFCFIVFYDGNQVDRLASQKNALLHHFAKPSITFSENYCCADRHPFSLYSSRVFPSCCISLSGAQGWKDGGIGDLAMIKLTGLGRNNTTIYC